MALVIHEMMTNAAKYGALSTQDGRLELSWSLAPNGDCVLEWLELAGPPVLPPTQEGFGGKLIRNTMNYDLRGAILVEYRKTGLFARFTIPAAHLIDPAIVPPSGPAIELPEAAFLSGRTVLVVEDQAVIAMDMEDTVRKLGATDVTCTPDIHEALQALQSQAPDCAILDFNLGDQTSALVADELLARGVPFVFATGYGDSVMIPARFETVPVLRKPVSAALLLEAFSRSPTPAEP